MGYGDEIMASGQAWKAYSKNFRRCVITTYNGVPRWSDMWLNLPFIVNPMLEDIAAGDKAFNYIVNGPQCRPYLQYPWKMPDAQTFTDWRAQDYIGRLRFSAEEYAIAIGELQKAHHPISQGNWKTIKPIVFIEPTINPEGNPNKQWGLHNWFELMEICEKEFRFIICGRYLTDEIRTLLPNNYKFIPTQTFREAACIMSLCSSAVLPESGLAHAAGALSFPAVVLFGSVSPVETFGYDTAVNFGSEGWCGRWSKCGHCTQNWENITPEMVRTALRNQVRKIHDAPRWQ